MPLKNKNTQLINTFIQYNKLWIFIIFVLVIILVIISSNYFLKRREKFEDTTTTAFDIKTVPTTDTNKKTTCDNPTDIPSVCINFDNCCTNNMNNINGECFCKHPFVINCNNDYKKCISNGNDGSNKELCSDILKNCCNKYSSINILNNNFQKPIMANQDADKLCSINGISNLEQRCMELCQTNSNCKSYTLSTGRCNLYSTVNTIPNSNTDNSIYVIKK